MSFGDAYSVLAVREPRLSGLVSEAKALSEVSHFSASDQDAAKLDDRSKRLIARSNVNRRLFEMLNQVIGPQSGTSDPILQSATAFVVGISHLSNVAGSKVVYNEWWAIAEWPHEAS
jgi:hypothetical protein